MTLIPNQKRKKWDENSEKLIFVGYDSNVKGYRLINPKNRKLTISRDVNFLDGRESNTIEISFDSAVENEERGSDDRSIDDGSIVDENDMKENVDNLGEDEQNENDKTDETTEFSSSGEQDSEYLPDQSIGSVPQSNITLRKKVNNHFHHCSIVI